MKTVSDDRKEMVEDGFADVPEAAKFLRVSRATLYALMDSGEIPFAKFGRCRRIPLKSLREYAARSVVVA